MEDLSRSQALKALSKYKDAYNDLVARAYIAVVTYEQYLMDQLSHKELAEEMTLLLRHLPDRVLDGKIPPAPESHSEGCTGSD